MNYIKQFNYHKKAVNQCLTMIENIEILLSYNSLSVQEIFNLLSQSNLYNLLTFIICINENMKTKENKNILNDCNMNYINNNLYL